MKTIAIFCLALLMSQAPATFAAAERGGPGGGAVTLGEYSNVREDAEHCSGYAVDLWRSGSRLYGIFRACAGMVDQRPEAVLEHTSYDRKTGRISFDARLSMGSDYLGGGRQAPSRDVFSFKGSLRASELTGVLSHGDLVHEDAPAVAKQIRLKRNKVVLPKFESTEQGRVAAK